MTCKCMVVLLIAGEWLKYDDDEVSVVLEEDILKLSGGGLTL